MGKDYKYIVEVKEIYKEFHGNIALNSVSVSFNEGEIHAICGENGAGKSTLMKVLCGVFIPEAGDIYVKGEKAILDSPSDMMKYGISIIFQEFNLMEHLTVDENIYISNLKTRSKTPFLNKNMQKSETNKLLGSLGIDINPKSLITELSVSERQMVEIAKALSMNADVIIMDEPTAALNNKEVEKLYEILHMLKKRGKTIIYVSHRMKEIFDLADRVTVLRDGKYVATKDISEVTHDSIAHMMVGRSVEMHERTYRKFSDNNPVLEVEGLTKKKVFSDVSFALRKGEILGISGLMGCGRMTLAQVLYGLDDYDSGTIRISGSETKMKDPIDAMTKGIMYLTDDRKESGIFEKMGVGENLIINILKDLLSKNGVTISKEKKNDLIQQQIDKFNIRCSHKDQQILYLSGGNQQKVLVARALTGECKILILLEPTRGVDIATKSEIYAMLADLHKQGISIIFISSDLPEMISMCDRILVMWQGQITGEFSQKDMENMNEHAIMMCATGRIQNEERSAK